MFNTKHHLLREMAAMSPHIRNLLPVAAIAFDTLDRIGTSYTSHRVRQVAIGADHIGKFQHPTLQPRRPSRITIERRDKTGTPLDLCTVDDAIAWRSNPWLP